MSIPNTVGRAYRGNHSYTAMEAFDRLPKAVREALRNSDHNWSAAQLYHEHKRGKFPQAKTAKAMVALLAASDKAKHDDDAAQGLVMPGQRGAP